MKMIDAILEYVRSWFPANEFSTSNEFSRKRRGSDHSAYFRSPKHRKVLSSVTNNIIEDECFSSPLRTSILRPMSEKTVVIDDDDDSFPVGRRRSSENRFKTNGNDDLTFLKAGKSTSEKKLEAKKNGVEYITRFSAGLDPITTKSPVGNGAKPKPQPKPSPIFKSPRSRRYLNESLASPTLDYSIRLEDKKTYQMLLENVALQNSFNKSFDSSSVYGTPIGGAMNRSARLVELAKSKQKLLDTIDLTNESRAKLSTKDRVIKVLDDFETEVAVVEDSDSDVEILPNPPSPKPDIKVPHVNSLKTVVDTSKPAHQKWLEDITKKHQQYVVDKSKEIEAYEKSSSTLSEINKDLLLRSLTRKVQDSLSIKDTILPIVEVEEEVELPELTDEQLRMVKKALSGDPNEVLTKKFNLNVNRRDIQTLAGLNWLNDNVINFYMNLIMERGGSDAGWPKAYATNTFFYQRLTSSGPESLKRWTRKIDLFSYEFVCVPIHLGMHWCMAIINLKEKTIKYYDSMGKPNNQCLNALRGYLEFEHKDKKGTPYSTEDFVLENVQDIPQQMNGSDCGMFSCTFAEFATRKAKFTFQQEDMPYLRKKMVVEILKGELLIQ